MRSILAVKTLAVAAILAGAAMLPAQNTTNPINQIRWPLITGSGAPTMGCQSAAPPPANSSSYGQMYVDMTNKTIYVCSSPGSWIQLPVATLFGAGAPAATCSTTVNSGAVYNDTTGHTLYICQGSAGAWQGPFAGTGPVGPPGPPTLFKGDWDNTKAYNANDGVNFNGSSFVALVANTNVQPPSTCVSSATWGRQACQASAYAGVVSNGNNGLNSTGSIVAANLLPVALSPSLIQAYGDSITACGFVTQSTCDVYYVAKAFGVLPSKVTNSSIPSSNACDLPNQQVFMTPAPTPALPMPLTMEMIGTNDVLTATNQGNFRLCNQATLTWRGVTSPNKVLASTGTVTGTCVNDTTYSGATGEICTAPGSTITLGMTTNGGPIYVWRRVINGDTGTYTYSLDGGAAVPLTAAPPSPITSGVGSTQSIMLLRLPAAAGAHSIVFTQTGAGSMPIVAIGSGPNVPFTTTNTAQFQSQPPIIVMQIPNQQDGNQLSSINNYRALVAADYNLLGPNGDGLNLIWGPVDQTVQATTAAGDMANVVHMNQLGHQELAAAALANIKVASVAGVATTVTPPVLIRNLGGAPFEPVAADTGSYNILNNTTSGVQLDALPANTIINMTNLNTASFNITANRRSPSSLPLTIPPLTTVCAISDGTFWESCGGSASNVASATVAFGLAMHVVTVNGAIANTAAPGDFVNLGNSGASGTFPTSTANAAGICYKNSTTVALSLSQPAGGSIPSTIQPGAIICGVAGSGGTWILSDLANSPATLLWPKFSAISGATVTISSAGSYANSTTASTITLSTTMGTGALICIENVSNGDQTISTTWQGAQVTRLPKNASFCAIFNAASYNLIGGYGLPPINVNITTATQGTGFGTPTCTTTCTDRGGTYSLTTTASVSPEVALTLVWPTTTTARRCMATQNDGNANEQVSHSVATATGMTISVGATIPTSTTVIFDYFCYD